MYQRYLGMLWLEVTENSPIKILHKKSQGRVSRVRVAVKQCCQRSRRGPSFFSFILDTVARLTHDHEMAASAPGITLYIQSRKKRGI